ncbi:MAG TPA: glutathione S-transferase family protein [Caulobacterales bacterium]|nr:glutathione S-transferase family protein [Caulobacterales bacterium]
MTAPFRLYGAETSPYSLKLRSYLIFKGLEFEWRDRTHAGVEEFARYAKLPLAPVLVDAEENVLQDSTPTIEALEREFPEPSIVPADPALAFLAALIEDYADEWLAKAMFHYRWSYADDQAGAARRIADMLYEGAEAPEGVVESIRARMAARLHHVGSSSETAALIEGSFARLLEIVERQLAGRPYLLGGRPCIADFALAAQFAQLAADPTPGAMIRARAPNVTGWTARMERARVEGEFEDFAVLREGLAELLQAEVAGAYLAWMAANARAVADDGAIVHVEIAGAPFTQKPQRYAAKGFAALRAKHSALEEHSALAALLSETGCAQFLAHAAAADEDGEDGEAEE